MRKFRDFKCTGCGAVFERLIEDNVTTIDYPACGCKTMAERQLSAPKLWYMKMGVDPHGCPTAADKWAKAHIQRGKNGGEAPQF